MCGFAGELRRDGQSAELAPLEAMLGALAPRGPDGDGVFQAGPLALGHKRLKIIDLSDRAAQPMVDAELGLAIAYNGAIYNYPELRRELIERGYRFFSSGDTEVILKAYHAFGPRFVERLNGMFAFAIWERDTGRVLLARDRLGIKPLYYTRRPDRTRFASTLPALLAGGGVSAELDPVAIAHYLRLHSVVPAPHTVLEAVRKVRPGSLLFLEPDGSMREETYWSLEYGSKDGDPSTEQEWKEALAGALGRAVERRLVADVPVGVLLSGGLDSSLIVGLLAERGQSGLHTFSIGFESVGEERGDEFRYSDVIAERFHTEHHKIFVTAERLLPNLDVCVRGMSEPMVSHDNIGFFLLSQEVAKHVKVVQSGQGADEVFAGYHWYPPLQALERSTVDEAARAYAEVFFDRDHADLLRLLDPRFHGGDHTLAFVREHFAKKGASSAIDRALRLDTTVMLVEDPVKRVDNNTMAFGLEARVPFLDHELVELAARMPSDLKVRNGGKYLLKEVARDVIPADVIDRPKGYFPVPALKYLEGPYLERVRQIFAEPRAKTRGLIQPEYLAELFERPDAHITKLGGSKLWQLALLEHWLQVHGL